MVERLFFALWPPPQLRDALIHARGGLHGTRSRWIRPVDLHLTLVFVGAVEAQHLGCVAAAGDDVAMAPFELSLDQLQDWRRNRLRVAKPTKAPAALFNLVSQLQHNLLVCGFEPEKRPYRPHVTLARKAPPIEPSRLDLSWQVFDFVLAASRSSGGSAYQVLRRWNLGQ
jgi:2'-5' RNA ligase